MLKKIPNILFHVLMVIFISACKLSGQINIVIIHPTAKNLENYLELIEKKCIDIENYRITGVYHTMEVYNYSQSRQWIKNSGHKNIRLIGLSDTIQPTEIFRTNALTPWFKSITDSADVIFFNGGPDIPPAIYGQPTHLMTIIEDPYRHYFEISFLFHLVGNDKNPGFTPLLALKKELPVWCFCLGLQSLNVAAGGTLIQDIPIILYHTDNYETLNMADSNNRHKNYEYGINPFAIDDQCWFHPLKFTDTIKINAYFHFQGKINAKVYSYHHQCVDNPGCNLLIAATSSDGKIPEILYHKTFPNVWGFQFHPEYAGLYNFKGSDEPYLKKIATFTFDSASMNFHAILWEKLSNILKSNRNK